MTDVPVTIFFDFFNVSSFTKYNVRAVATYANATFAGACCRTTMYDGEGSKLRTDCKYILLRLPHRKPVYQVKLLIILQYCVKNYYDTGGVRIGELSLYIPWLHKRYCIMFELTSR